MIISLTLRDGLGSRISFPVDRIMIQELKRAGCIILFEGREFEVLEPFDTIQDKIRKTTP